jgi:hypothetical protein
MELRPLSDVRCPCRASVPVVLRWTANRTAHRPKTYCFRSGWKREEEVLEAFMLNEANLIFKCPKCTWWIAGIHISPGSLTKLQMNEQMFDLNCAEQVAVGQVSSQEAKVGQHQPLNDSHVPAADFVHLTRSVISCPPFPSPARTT